MNITALKTVATKLYMKIQKKSPELALGGAIVFGISAIVSGCMASRKVDAILDEAHEELNDILEEHNENVDTNVRKESMKVYLKTGGKLVKLYAPTLIFCGTSVSLMLTSHGILNKRYAGAAAAYKALDEAFKGYRKRVAGYLGEDVEKIVMAGGTAEKNIKIQNDETSEEEITKGTNIVINDHKKSPYEFD